MNDTDTIREVIAHSRADFARERAFADLDRLEAGRNEASVELARLEAQAVLDQAQLVRVVGERAAFETERDEAREVTRSDGHIINDLVKRAEAAEGRARLLAEALSEIAKGEGAFSTDPLEHAGNTIEAMKQVAREALAEPEAGETPSEERYTVSDERLLEIRAMLDDDHPVPGVDLYHLAGAVYDLLAERAAVAPDAGGIGS